MKRISIGSWSFSLGPFSNNPVPWTELLSRLKQLGYDGIEVAGFSIHPRPENQPTKEDRERIKQEAATIGIEFPSYIPDLWCERIIDTDDPSGYLRAFRRGLEFAADIGAKALCIDTLARPGIFREVDYETAVTRLSTVWKRCAKEAADYGLYIGWEFEPVYAFNKPSEVIRIVEEVNEDNFGIAFDTCLAEMIGRYGFGQFGTEEILHDGCIEYARRLRGKINHIHLMDCDGIVHLDGKSNQRSLGEGSIDLKAALAELNSPENKAAWLVIDPGLPDDPWGMAEKCRKYLAQSLQTVV
ncbi:MAG: sugar phosphate isomerase/epimerase [Candidatus Hydrogenedentes bacterium]|nr:sugar phosphate isomerase/epimerase [Candidatus Hydrogenedentota bacterium]